ncbi:signal recognition particle-docking protein FtsY [Gluconobacter cerinus]|uniref:signal recognition particle-docking protein FtsY n=1 Tax=Gluconobacter TaxID=441 RepID=UPI001B8C63EE|nr:MULTISPECIES: signal recognition particle-docking protein FtsY [Gluconobacter]MBS0993503.1 signal recognition particle-docking protein FtsY [Gluconobacter cerinus]MBS1023279.1 signal recognition particle-docking protein FtsY [Gluconobacter cerinus]
MAGFFSRLKQGLSRSSSRLGAVFTHRKLDDAALEELEDELIAADLGPVVAERVIESFRSSRFGKDVTSDEIRDALAEEIARVLEPVAIPFEPDPKKKPHVVLVVGVNGVGKTTTIGKMARHYSDEGKSVMLVAGDTFRAAAVEQLQVWGQRSDVPVIAGKHGADAAGLAYDGIKRATEEGKDLLFIDTAGRLHNKGALMEELAKIIRVMQKFDPTAPHSVLLVLDATTGQNAIEQVRVFRELVNVTGLIVTKLDGSARGGIVVALAEQFKLPVHMVGVGEQAEDLRPFSAQDYARGLVGGATGDLASRLVESPSEEETPED